MIGTIVTAVIGAIATVAAAYIGRQSGVKKGIEEGRRHSILRFLDEHEKQLDRGMDAIDRRDYRQLEAIATAVVDNILVWRKIQENFRALLNGRIDDLAGTLRQGNPEFLENNIRALHEGFRARRLAVETELEKSKI